MKSKRKRPETFEADHGDRKVRVTVPANDEAELFEAIREQLSPHAVAAVISCLRINRTNNSIAVYTIDPEG